jgi:uncharacterized protein (DUF2147 family)
MKKIQTLMAAFKANYKKMTLLFVGSLLIIAGAFAFNLKADNPDGIVGVWKTGEPNDPETGKPKVDKNHPDEASKTRAILGLVNIWGFNYKGENVWDGGNIYDPKNGNTYSCTMKLQNANSLEVRGYIGVAIIGRTDTWTKQVLR